eukprot:10915555-Karenia_brevis.AAC.1
MPRHTFFTRALFDAGAWGVHSSVMSVYRGLYGYQHDIGFVSDIHVLTQCGLLPPLAMLRVLRLSLFSRFLNVWHSHTVAAVCAAQPRQKSWLCAVMEDLKFLALFVP